MPGEKLQEYYVDTDDDGNGTVWLDGEQVGFVFQGQILTMVQAEKEGILPFVDEDGNLDLSE